jgi:hypothetical protein
MTSPSSAMNNSISDTIRVARIFCILLLVYVHVPPHLAGVPSTLFSPAGVIYYLRLLLGHTSVPLLSLISGYLLTKTLSDRPYAAELRNKFFSLIVPLVLWNLIYLLKEYLESGFTAIPPLHDWPNAVLAITSYPAMTTLYFLRDAFVCFLISPVFIYLARKIPGTAAMALLLNVLFNVDGPLFIKSAIPLFYFAGCVLQIHKMPVPTQAMRRWPVVVAGLTMLLLPAAQIYAPPAWDVSIPDTVLFSVVDIPLRVAGTVVFWVVACQLRNGRVGAFLFQFEPIAFFIFCAHTMIAGIWWMVISRLSNAAEPTVYLSYFVASPLLVLVTSVFVAWFAVTVAPKAMRYLLGGRAPTPKQLQRMWSQTPSKPRAHSL